TRYSGEGQEERYPELCREVVRTKPDVIVTASTRLVLSFKAATNTVPVVAAMGDPVPVGIVANIARPEGNITGVSSVAGTEIWGKRLQVMREAVPAASKMGFLGITTFFTAAQNVCFWHKAEVTRLVGPSEMSALTQSGHEGANFAVMHN